MHFCLYIVWVLFDWRLYANITSILAAMSHTHFFNHTNFIYSLGYKVTLDESHCFYAWEFDTKHYTKIRKRRIRWAANEPCHFHTGQNERKRDTKIDSNQRASILFLMSYKFNDVMTNVDILSAWTIEFDIQFFFYFSQQIFGARKPVSLFIT